MSSVESRRNAREDAQLRANVRVEHDRATHSIRVRNLSDGGMMGEGDLRVQRGNRLAIELRNVGAVEGSVAWVQDNRFGIAFDAEVDAAKVHA